MSGRKVLMPREVYEMLIRKLPSVRTLWRLAELDGPFPRKNKYIILTAERFWFSEDVMTLLRHFPPSQVFSDREHFVQCCEQLVAKLRQEQNSPFKKLRELWRLEENHHDKARN